VNGEVEDYEVNIQTVAELGITRVDAPDPIAVGSNAIYVVTLTNSGPSLATGVTLAEALPSGVTFLFASSSQGGCNAFAGTVLCSLGLLNAGASATVSVTVVPTVEGSLTNSITLSANEADLNPNNNAVKRTMLAMAPPQITVQPQSQTVSNGGTATLSVTAAGPSLRYQWRRDATDLSGATNSVLTLTNLQLVNEGLYTVRVSNPVGVAVSSGALVSVLTPIVISAQPQSQSVLAGQTVTFSVTATGSAPLAYHWDRDTFEIPGETAPTLVLPSVQTNQSGAYRVRVSNSWAV
jgi:uncharacterized repeat protein (TIGR01451 family)